ncbi:MAG TPA: sigma-70 domain-containing protein [Stellaceae bacterium]|nr:sigma-70 domain-containing protein [Stellaceae bacterium]
MTDVPAHLIETINRLVRTRQRMRIESGRDPTADELAERLSMPAERVGKLLDIALTPVRG